MIVQHQYAESLRQGQESWKTTTHHLQKIVNESVESWGNQVSPSAVDQVFDFWEWSLCAQRDLTKQAAGNLHDLGERLLAGDQK